MLLGRRCVCHADHARAAVAREADGDCRTPLADSGPWLRRRRQARSPRAQAQGAPGEQAGGARLLLLDGHSLAYRAFFALPAENFTTTTGQPTNAVYGFTSMLINLLRDEAPTHVAVAFDVSRQTFRSEAYAEYKANRSATPDEFKGQVSLIEDVLAALRIPVVERGGLRGRRHHRHARPRRRGGAGHATCSICTGDRDAFQLVNDQVTVLYPRKGVSELARFTPEAVQEQYGADPGAVPGLRGAARRPVATTCPSIPGVGEKTAAKWIREFGSLDDLVDRVDEVKGKAGDALRENLSDVMLNRQLTELVTRRRARRATATSWRCGPGTATRCTSSSTSWSSGSCASACSPR